MGAAGTHGLTDDGVHLQAGAHERTSVELLEDHLHAHREIQGVKIVVKVSGHRGVAGGPELAAHDQELVAQPECHVQGRHLVGQELVVVERLGHETGAAVDLQRFERIQGGIGDGLELVLDDAELQSVLEALLDLGGNADCGDD